MKWKEVRELYPNTFVKFEVVESHTIEDKEIVDEIALIKVIKDGKEAMKEFFKDNKKGQLVYSTENEELVIKRVYMPNRRNMVKMNEPVNIRDLFKTKKNYAKMNEKEREEYILQLADEFLESADDLMQSLRDK